MSDDVVVQPETTEKKPGGITGKGFVKGDTRINRKGRPRNFDALRKLAQTIAIETIPSPDDTEVWTRVEKILRDWTVHDHQSQKDFLEIAYGKVPAELIHSFKNMSDEQLRKFIESGIRILGASDPGGAEAEDTDSESDDLSTAADSAIPGSES